MIGLKPVIADMMQGLRKTEMNYSKTFRVVWVITKSIGITCHMLTPIIIVTAALYLTRFVDGLSPVEIFTTLAFVSLTAFPMLRLMNSYSLFTPMLGCFQRIQAYLLLGERQDDRETISDLVLRMSESTEKDHSRYSALEVKNSRVQRPSIELQLPQPPIVFVDASITAAVGKVPLLKNVNISITRAEIAVVVGRTGSGKTTFLRSILGEAPAISGLIYVERRQIAYCDQSPWLKSISIRENIIGDQPYERDWYETVLHACLLNEDLRQLPNSDQTAAGNGGTNLSGGQRQRVALARAVYSRAPLLVLDNVFSSLDRPTADIVFCRLFTADGLFKRIGSTVIMTTHAVEYIKTADRILMIENDGSVRSLSNVADAWHNQTEVKELIKAKPNEPDLEDTPPTQDQITSQCSVARNNPVSEKMSCPRQQGDLRLYSYYLASASKWTWSIWLLTIVIDTATERLPDIFIRIWVDHAPKDKFWLLGYILLGCSHFIWSAITLSIYHLQIVPATSESLHRKLVDTVMECTLSFLSSTNSGSILNLFSQDMTLVSQDLPSSFYLFVYFCCLTLLDVAIITSGSTYAASVIPFIFAFLYLIQYFYLRTSRQIRHLDLEAKTPLYTQFTELAAGLLHIRSFGWHAKYLSQSLAILDFSQRPFYYMFCIQRWLTLVIDLSVLGIATVLVSTALCIKDTTTQGAIGLALLNLVNFGVVIGRLVEVWVSLETSLGAISRIRSFAENTPIEQDREQASLPPGCLKQGAIQIIDVTSTYNGKSSLILTLLNFLDYTGVVRIDGIDLLDIPRQALRSIITTIPQDLVELPGSVRHNILPDTISTASDKSQNGPLNEVLDKVGLVDYIASRGGLDAPLADMGFSHGQRQLLSLARAMLHKLENDSSILLVDEATSSLDVETARVMQQVIEEAFRNCTTITISHQPETLKNADLVVEIDDGRIVSIAERRASRGSR
ncbi:hypothetical protein QQS21_002139 [Conoideocrella luteorostrata]|uniref:P-loop containing nucleoside triphosphate hydrolase protein n=1 Tax=Conoideocrella luteorostrata TaxID=1105319 RepID=A0AAJ0CYW4_9HYPO|nr:hypothetical protein QQS21_002139 [Conoideocrella luteorostrata]